MAVSIVSSQTISGDTFYRNKPFDISFSLVSSVVTDASLYFSNSTYGVLPYVSNNSFQSGGINAVGNLGTIQVDAITSNRGYVSTATAQAYNATGGVCTDPSGYVYFVTASCNQMFRIDLSGTTSVYAGTGTAGGADGDRLTTAQFNSPVGVTTDGSGTFYVTDSWRLRKISPAGIVSTLAGNGTQGYVDGSGSVARFTFPNNCVIDPCGDILISESDFHIIRKVKPNGDTTTYAGVLGTQGYLDGPITTATFQLGPYLVGAGLDGWVFLSGFPEAGWSWGNALPTDQPDFYALVATSNKLVYGGIAAPTDGGPIWYASTPNTATLTSASGLDLDGVLGIAYNGSNLYVAGGYKTGSNRPLYYSSDGETWSAPASPGSNVLRVCVSVSYGNGLWIACGVGSNDGVSDASENFMTSTDGSNWTRRFGSGSNRIPGRIRRVAYGNGRWVCAGNTSAGSNLMYSTDDAVTWTTVANPMPGRDLGAIAYGNGMWVLGGDKTGNPLYYSTDAVTWTVGSGAAAMPFICNVYYSRGSNMFIATGGAGAIALSTDGITWGQGGALGYTMISVADTCLNKWIAPPGSARMYFPAGMVFDPSGTLYIADQYNNRIRTIQPGASAMTTFAGTGTDTISNGTLTTAGMARPAALARDPSSGTIYVTSHERFTIQTIEGNNVSLFAGSFFASGYIDGPGLSARFNGLTGIAVFGNNVYVGEVYNRDVRKITVFPEVRAGQIRPTGYTIIASSNYPVTLNSRIDVSWTSVGGSLPLYKYEPFCNTFTAKVAGDTLGYSLSSTELLGYLTGTGTANVAFRAPGGATTAYPYTLTLAVQDLCGTTLVEDVSTSVTIYPSRVLVTPCNANLVFYRNEPIAPVTFSLASSPTSLLYSASSLPTGLTLARSASNASVLTGTPTTQTLCNRYTIVAQDTSGRTYSTEVSMIVNPERLVIDSSGSTFFGSVLSTAPVAPVTLTARFPPYTSYRSMRYTWSSQPPGGLQFRDICGVAISGSSYSVDSTQDASFSLTLSGTITEAQVRAYAKMTPMVSNVTTTIVGTRTFPVPSLSPSIPTTLTFTLGRTILFDSNVPTPFVGITIPDSGWWYSAKSYFGTDVSITNISVTDGFLPDGVTGGFTSNLQRFDLCGTPTTLTSYGFTLTAVANGGALTASLPISLSTVQDVVTIFPGTDTCSTYIQTRDVASTKLGYYSNPIYTAIAASTCNTTITASGLPDGVTLTTVGSNGYTLSGRPTTPVGLSSAVLTAFVPASGVTATKTLLYSVSAERFTFTFDPSAALTFAQNVPISPVDVIATTFSENPILRYSSGNLPPELTITNAGTILGTPVGSTDGTLTVDTYTAYATASTTASYTITDDAVLLQPSVYTTTTAPGGNVSIPITGYSLSALTVSNYRFSNAFPYGLTINPTTGLLSGTLSSTLPVDVPFTLLGSAGIVDGSLNGLMHTDNLTVNRTQMLGLDASALSIYSSDTNGLTWSTVGGPYSDTTALTIGTNGSNVYLIPISSNAVLKSTDGATYTPRSFTGTSPVMTAVANKPGTSTWWIAGSIPIASDERNVYIYKSTDDGETWDSGTLVSPLTDRGGNIEPYTTSYQAYINGGVALAYKDGVLLIGGDRILRSTNEGASWSAVVGGFVSEVAYFSLDHETVWVATGSDGYQSRTSLPYAGATATIKYSVDAGLTWTNASAFNMFAYEIRHGLGQWMATGIDWVGPSEEAEVKVRYSFDGVTWTALSAVPAVGYASAFTKAPPLPITLGFDETDWVLFRTPDDGTITRYAHPYSTPLTSGWVSQTVGPPPSVTSTSRFTSYVAQTIDPGADVTTITFPLPNTGPTFVSPVQSTYVLWQYMPVPPIVFSAPGATSYFVSTLPVGLTWNGTTQTVTGACMRTGTQTFTVYAKNSGITAFTVTLLVEVPRIIKQQSGAGAYTSLVRQYTEVNAAQNARDTRALPAESRTLGEFASPYPPSVVSPSNCPC
jgi:hypothetical protein